MTTTARLTSSAVALVCLAGALSGCGAAEKAVSNAKSAKATTVTETAPTSSAASGSSVPSRSGTSDAPIGSGDINLSTSADAKSYPADQLSRPGAIDCYSGGSRIYDRHGITCDGARRTLTQYEATPASAKGTQARVGDVTCAHNPDIMVTQGAAPGTCVDSSGNVVFNWRYPGAPLPARS